MLRAALFDVFGTVVDWRSGVAREVAHFFETYGVRDIGPLAFADAWRRRYGPSMEEVRSGRRPFERLDVLHLESLKETLTEFKLDVGAFKETDLAELNLAWHWLDPWPDAVAGLTRMKSKLIIAPLSNGNISLLLDMAKRAALPWDAILGAEVARAYKPMPEAYLRTVDVLGFRPEEVVMVAAHNDDLTAASACGLRTAFVPRPTEHGFGQTRDLKPLKSWDYVATNFVELAAALAG